jgi:hypothetical protein
MTDTIASIGTTAIIVLIVKIRSCPSEGFSEDTEEPGFSGCTDRNGAIPRSFGAERILGPLRDNTSKAGPGS